MCSTPAHLRRLNIYYYSINKEEIILSSIGYIQVHAFTSNAQIPLKDVAITITDVDGAAIAMRLTNRSGTLDEPVPIPVPDLSASQSYNTGIIPFTSVDIYARREDYEEVYYRRLQVFADTITNQNMEIQITESFPYFDL